MSTSGAQQQPHLFLGGLHGIDHRAPPAGNACMSRPRAPQHRKAFSNDRTPATWRDNSPISGATKSVVHRDPGTDGFHREQRGLPRNSVLFSRFSS